MRKFIKIILIVSIFFSLFAPIYVWAVTGNLNTGANKSANDINNDALDKIWKDGNFFSVWTGWETWIKNTLWIVALSMKSVLFFAAWVYFLILVLKLLYTDNSEEESEKFKKWIIWITIGLIVTQSAYWFVNVIFDNWISEGLGYDIIKNVLEPLLYLLQTLVSFFFIWVAIYTFYKMVTANGDEEKVKKAKTSIIHAIIWFIAIKISGGLVSATYWKINCRSESFSTDVKCLWSVNLEWTSWIVVNLINWMNSFIWIIVVIMIIYTWSKVLLSAWDPDVLKKAKSSILYIIIWLVILVANYLILSFFIFPESWI